VDVKIVGPAFFRKGTRWRIAFSAVLPLFLMLIAAFPLHSGSPGSAYYSAENDRIFWFAIISDIHIGAHGYSGSENLLWFLDEARDVINPLFIVNTGDLTDSTNWDTDIYPDGPHLEEWVQYKAIVDASGVTPDIYYDLPGNHDHYSDANFDYYLAYSLQGSATGQTQFSWREDLGFGTYHFLGVNTCGNDGAQFSLAPPYYGDNAGLDHVELTYINDELVANSDADLTMIFGHHAIDTRSPDLRDWALRDAQEWTETALRSGADEFVSLMESYDVLMYGYGHSHIYREEFFVRDMTMGTIYLNVGSLTKSDADHYSIVAIDCNGISTTSHTLGVWPAVIITAPLDKNLGMKNNPYTTGVVDLSGDTAPVRALVFDKVPVTSVEYRMYQLLDSGGEFVQGGLGVISEFMKSQGMWQPMTQVDAGHASYPYLWEADCPTPLTGGTYTLEVRATGSTTQKDSIPTAFPSLPVDDNKNMWCFITAASPHYKAEGLSGIGEGY